MEFARQAVCKKAMHVARSRSVKCWHCFHSAFHCFPFAVLLLSWHSIVFRCFPSAFRHSFCLHCAELASPAPSRTAPSRRSIATHTADKSRPIRICRERLLLLGTYVRTYVLRLLLLLLRLRIATTTDDDDYYYYPRYYYCYY